MPIGPITPGEYVSVTPDIPVVGYYGSVQAPSAGMPVIAEDVQALTLVALNIQDKAASVAAAYDAAAISREDTIYSNLTALVAAWMTGAFSGAVLTTPTINGGTWNNGEIVHAGFQWKLKLWTDADFFDNIGSLGGDYDVYYIRGALATDYSVIMYRGVIRDRRITISLKGSGRTVDFYDEEDNLLLHTTGTLNCVSHWVLDATGWFCIGSSDK